MGDVMRELIGTERMTITLNEKELTKITFNFITGANIINYGKGSVYVTDCDEVPNLLQDDKGIVNAVFLINGASNNMLLKSSIECKIIQNLWLYALDKAIISIQCGAFAKTGILYGGTGIVDIPLPPEPPKPIVYKLLDGEIPMGNNGDIVGSGMIIDGKDVDFNHLGITDFSEHSIGFGSGGIVTLGSDGTGMVVKHIAYDRKMALPGAFYDDEGSSGVYYPHYKKRILMDLQIDDFKTSIPTPFIFTADGDYTVYSYDIRLDVADYNPFNNVRFCIKIGKFNEYDKKEQPILAETCYVSDWYKDCGVAAESGVMKIILTNGFLLEKGKEYTLFAENYDMTTKKIKQLPVLGDVNGVPWSVRDCQPCEILPIIEGYKYMTSSEIIEMSDMWMANKGFDPPRTTVFNTDIMCLCNLVANRKHKPQYTWYAVDGQTSYSLDAGVNDFSFLEALANGNNVNKWASQYYTFKEEFQMWVHDKFMRVSTDLLILGDAEIRPPETISDSLFLNSRGKWVEPKTSSTSSYENVIYDTTVGFQETGSYYVVANNNTRKTWESVVSLNVMVHDTTGKPPNNNKWKAMIPYEWDSSSQVLAMRAKGGQGSANNWIAEGMPAKMYVTYAQTESTTPDLVLQGIELALQGPGQYNVRFKTDLTAADMDRIVWHFIGTTQNDVVEELVVEEFDWCPNLLVVRCHSPYGWNSMRYIVCNIYFKYLLLEEQEELILKPVIPIPIQRVGANNATEEPIKLGIVDRTIQSVKTFFS